MPSVAVSIDIRRRQLLYRAENRGTREMCILLGGFVRTHINQWQDEQLDELEKLLECADTDLYHWLAKTKSPPATPAPPAGDILKALIDAVEQRCDDRS
ncbi:MAG: succinate dehydrogenase assembly factor 2 [Pseudomonadota bacterium]